MEHAPSYSQIAFTDLRSLVALSLVPLLGSRRIRALIEVAGSASQVFTLTLHDLLRVPGIGAATSQAIVEFKDWKRVDAVLEQGERLGVRLMGLEDPDYPALLLHIPDPPILLWIRGNVAALKHPMVAVIGTRRPSEYGMAITQKLTTDLVDAGLCIVSGLAYGIDAIAHEAALKSNGLTVAVLGSGINRIYPGAHRSLAYRILEQEGCIISEFPPGTKPEAGNFPVRNRVVSGLCKGTLVIETKGEGGSMITARLALEQNREVFAIPHRMDAPQGQGCNLLIQQAGAKLVLGVEDILAEWGMPFDPQNREPLADMLQPKTGKLWEASELQGSPLQICQQLSSGITEVDTLSEILGIPIAQLLPLLLELEFDGLLKNLPGKRVELL
jgi:DNA processing protein